MAPFPDSSLFFFPPLEALQGKVDFLSRSIFSGHFGARVINLLFLFVFSRQVTWFFLLFFFLWFLLLDGFGSFLAFSCCFSIPRLSFLTTGFVSFALDPPPFPPTAFHPIGPPPFFVHFQIFVWTSLSGFYTSLSFSSFFLHAFS